MTSTVHQEKTVWGLTLRERLILVLIGAAIVVAKVLLRIPIGVPGHSGIFWMALLVVGVGAVRKPGAGTVIGLVSGLLATLMLPGSKDGFLVGLKYLTPGIMVDLILPVLGGRLDRLSVAVVVAAIANTTKLVTSYIVGVVLGIPAGYLALGLGIAATTHIVFGGLGGALAAELLKRLYRTGVIGPVGRDAQTEVE